MARQVKEKEPNTPLANIRWEKFCQLYATDTEFFGNGVESYLEAYSDPDKLITYNAAKSNAHNLLTNAYILDRINELLDIYLSDQIVDKNLGLVVLQNADLRAKVAAIKEYNNLKRRTSQPSINILINAESREKSREAVQEALQDRGDTG